MKYFTFEKKTGLVLMISDRKNIYDNPEWEDLEVPDVEADLIDQEFSRGQRKIFVKDKKVEVHVSASVSKKETDKAKIKSAKNFEDLKQILTDILD